MKIVFRDCILKNLLTRITQVFKKKNQIKFYEIRNKVYKNKIELDTVLKISSSSDLKILL